MKELVDIVSVYLALTTGLATLWWSLFRNYPLEDCLVRTLASMAVVYVASLLARFIIALFLAFGGRKGEGKRDSAPGESRGRPESEKAGEA